MTPADAITAVFRAASEALPPGSRPDGDAFQPLLLRTADKLESSSIAFAAWNNVPENGDEIEAAMLEVSSYNELTEMAVNALLAVANFPTLERLNMREDDVRRIS